MFRDLGLKAQRVTDTFGVYHALPPGTDRIDGYRLSHTSGNLQSRKTRKKIERSSTSESIVYPAVFLIRILRIAGLPQDFWNFHILWGRVLTLLTLAARLLVLLSLSSWTTCGMFFGLFLRSIVDAASFLVTLQDAFSSERLPVD